MLISCPECKREISDKAISCPHCGYPMNPVTTIKYKKSYFYFKIKRSIIVKYTSYVETEIQKDDGRYESCSYIVIDKPTNVRISIHNSSLRPVTMMLIPPTDKCRAYDYEVSNAFFSIKVTLVGSYDYDPKTRHVDRPVPPPSDDDDDLPF